MKGETTDEKREHYLPCGYASSALGEWEKKK